VIERALCQNAELLNDIDFLLSGQRGNSFRLKYICTAA